MSIFNKPYRTDKQLAADNKHEKKQKRMKKRELKNKLAEKIYLATIDMIDGGADSISKQDMVGAVSGGTKKSDNEWFIWDKAATIAIQRIRRAYWSDRKEVTSRKLFNYDSKSKCYWIVDINDELMTNKIYEQYNRKMIGINDKQIEIADSAYQKVLELSPDKRQDLIKRLEEEPDSEI